MTPSNKHQRPHPWLRTRFVVALLIIALIWHAMWLNRLSGSELAFVITGISTAFFGHDVLSDKINRAKAETNESH